MRLMLIIVIMVIGGCSSQIGEVHQRGGASVTIISADSQLFTFLVELANTSETRIKGLMFREDLEDKHGMLFIYPSSQPRSFWMKNTKIPLDMLFIDENFVIRKIHYAEPCKQDPCAAYKSGVPVRYVLEINGNLTIKHGIEEGNLVDIQFKER